MGSELYLEISSICILFILSLQLLGVLFSISSDPYIPKEKKGIFLLVIVTIASLVAQNTLEYIFSTRFYNPFFRTILSIYGYALRPVVISLFCMIVSYKKMFLSTWILVTINFVIHLTALFTDFCFTIDENNSFQRGPLGYTCHIISAYLLVFLLIQTFKEYSLRKGSDIIIPIINTGVIIASVLLDSYISVGNSPVSFLTMALVTVSVFYYIWLHLQFVREHEEDLKAQQRIKIMMSQIQPHFLFNTLSTIQALCMTNPEKAAEVTGNFGIYLRQNLNSLDQTDLIPIKKELDHTKVYTEIEAVRFPSIKIDFEIGDEDFLLPALSIQPMVENAIRHGVRIRKNGEILVKTQSTDEYHEVIIKDNGMGFNPEDLETQEGSHIGLKNVKERIEKMCYGTFTVDSVVDEGTTITMRIPKGKK